MVILTRHHVPWFKEQLARNTIRFSQLQIEKLHLQYSGFEFPDNFEGFTSLIRRVFTKNNEVNLSEVADEVEKSLDLYIAAKSKEWKSLPCCELVEKVTTSSVNRVVVGVPLCRSLSFCTKTAGMTRIQVATRTSCRWPKYPQRSCFRSPYLWRAPLSSSDPSLGEPAKPWRIDIGKLSNNM